MGCINSKEELREIQTNSISRSSNVYRVNACRISADAETIQNGYLELSPKELAFLPEVGETIKWALQHLRRYGCTGDVFSFEAGRRCMTGPGIYTFRMHNAENMHRLFQSYINSVARNNDTAPLACTEFPTSLDLSSSHSQDPYLEPSSATSSLLQNRVAGGANLYRQDSAQSSPLSSNLNSPSSFQGANFTNEVIHLNAQPSSRFANPNSNLYQEFPIKPNEFNNNIPNKNNKSPQDVPPQELAPNIQSVESIDCLQHPRKFLPINNDDEQHMYENVTDLDKSAASSLEERCYENFSSINLPILINESTNKTPTNENSAVVNYITLDLVQSPTSTDSFSLKVKTNAATVGSGGGAAATAESSSTNVLLNSTKKDGGVGGNNEIVLNTLKGQEYRGNNSLLFPRAIPELSNSNAIDGVGGVNESLSSSSMGYSTIDFIKTCALIKTAPGCDVDCQESRITRHSTCVLKNSSLSE